LIEEAAILFRRLLACDLPVAVLVELLDAADGAAADRRARRFPPGELGRRERLTG